jgi:catechol 2,3-dioxygenase-like lactoylglutathione lyase family enzyme
MKAAMAHQTISRPLRFLGILSLSAILTVAQPAKPPADVLGLGFVGHHVADLERSIKFYEAIDFKLVGKPTDWAVDAELNRLGSTPGAESRTATMQVQSSVSDVPFTLYLRQYRGGSTPRQDWSKLSSWNLLASHMDLTYEGSVSTLLDKLDAMKLLVMPEVNGLPNPRTQAGAFRAFAFIQDPDGFVIEYFSKAATQPGAPPAAPKVSNSTATNANIDRLGKQSGFNHFATNIMDVHKAQDFYVKVLGGDYPSLEGHATGPQVMLHGWFPQANTNNNLRLELIYFALNDGKAAPPIRFHDINANHAGFQVSNIDTAYARAKANGAITVSDGGIIPYKGGRAALIRDSDVGGYIMLWQPHATNSR